LRACRVTTYFFQWKRGGGKKGGKKEKKRREENSLSKECFVQNFVWRNFCFMVRLLFLLRYSHYSHLCLCVDANRRKKTIIT
jgi:hypothetical protein